VQAVLHAPVAAYRVGEALGVGADRIDEQALLEGVMIAAPTFALGQPGQCCAVRSNAERRTACSAPR
jgi:hypothetical protein